MRSFVAVAVLVAVAANIAAAGRLYNATNDYPSPWIQSGIHTEEGPGDLGQINDHNCGPHSLMQCIYKLTGVDMREATLAEWAGTTEEGTSHDGLIDAVHTFNSEYGYKLSIDWYYYSDVSTYQIGQWMANPKTAMFFHLLYRDTWGHYELPYKITEGSDYLIIANSLGDSCGDGFCGYFETRSWDDQESYISGISQKSICVITNPN